ncbi:aminoglycoside phosphotransferase family protein [Streptomyces sp. NBC_01716]|uniref:aminoglycoside phosphotransferase family protein n=1 Tax=Streptomyces sp. NBC_01716 TaxID=2975917 RepID=UPI002E362456|nr:aminoglycoside phosphotransferase family protein [Streptomyces sp. NBC_01716]
MHADEVPTDVDLVRRLLAAQFPHWAGLPVEHFPSGGTVNAVYRLGDDMAVRLPRIEGGVADVAKEHRWLPWLAPRLPVPVPTVLGLGEPAEGYPWPWSVNRWLDGVHPEAGRLAQPGPLAADLAGFVMALRPLDTTDAPRAYRSGPLAEDDDPTRAALSDLRELGELGDRGELGDLGAVGGTIDIEAATAAWDADLRAPDWDGPPVWVHSDLMPDNLLVDGGRLSGVIDFGTMGVGDPASDLIPAWNLFPAGVRDGFRTALAADDATWARGRGRALSMALIQLPYYLHTNPRIAANARHVIREVLADHRARSAK